MFDDYAAPRRPPGALFRLPGYLHPPARFWGTRFTLLILARSPILPPANS